MIYDESSTRSFLSYSETLTNFRSVFNDFILTLILIGSVSSFAVLPLHKGILILVSAPFFIGLLSIKRKQSLVQGRNIHEIGVKDPHKRLIIAANNLGENLHFCSFSVYSSLLYASKIKEIFEFSFSGDVLILSSVIFCFLEMITLLFLDFFNNHKYENNYRYPTEYIVTYFFLFIGINLVIGNL